MPPNLIADLITAQDDGIIYWELLAVHIEFFFCKVGADYGRAFLIHCRA